MHDSAATATSRLPIRINYIESASSVMEALEQTRSPYKISKTQIVLWIVILTLLVVLFVIKGAVHPGGINWKGLAWNVVPVFLIAVFVYIFLVRRMFGKNAIKESYRKSTGRDETKVVCEFGEAAIFVSAEGGIASHFPWAALVRVVQGPKGLLVYQSPGMFHWFPKCAFASDADYRTVTELAKSKVANYEVK